jgi:membrane protease YdiL (CAAX protease family)
VRARTRVVAWSLAALAGAAVVPRPEPLVDFGAAAVALGLLVGVGLYVVLSGSVRVTVRTPGVTARITYVAARAAYEEALWRLCLLGLLAAAFGAVAGLSLTTLAFALSHWPRQGPTAAVHIVTGTVFGGVFLATGSFAAAVAAHAAYNAVVAANHRPFWPIGGARLPPYDAVDAAAR